MNQTEQEMIKDLQLKLKDAENEVSILKLFTAETFEKYMNSCSQVIKDLNPERLTVVVDGKNDRYDNKGAFVFNYEAMKINAQVVKKSE